MKDINMQIEKDINMCLDNHIKAHEMVIHTINKTKKEIANRKSEIFKIIKLFQKYGIEVCGYDINAFKNEPAIYEYDNSGIMTIAECMPYSKIVFYVKHPDNDIILNVRAMYECRSGNYKIKGDPKDYHYNIKGYELSYSLDKDKFGKQTVNEKSARANIIKNCIYSVGKTGYCSQHIRITSDKNDIDCFFYALNSILSIKNKQDVKKFKEFTAKAIIHNYGIVKDLESFNGNTKDPYTKIRSIKPETWSESHLSR
jgi:hypothetical protein